MLITLGALTIESITGSHGKMPEKWSSSKDSAIRGRHLDDHTATTHVYNQGPGSRYDEFLQLVQEHQTVVEAEEPDGEYGLTEVAELVEPVTEKARLKSKQVVMTVGSLKLARQ
ncbi:hypothetical protein FF1_043411 [Malus domestica]